MSLAFEIAFPAFDKLLPVKETKPGQRYFFFKKNQSN